MDNPQIKYIPNRVTPNDKTMRPMFVVKTHYTVDEENSPCFPRPWNHNIFQNETHHESDSQTTQSHRIADQHGKTTGLYTKQIPIPTVATTQHSNHDAFAEDTPMHDFKHTIENTSRRTITPWNVVIQKKLTS